MVAIRSLLTECPQLVSAGHAIGNARREPFDAAEKTGLTLAAKIAAERDSAELRYFTQPTLRMLRKTIGGKVREAE